MPPITDGAAAMVLATGDRARRLVERPAYITGFDHRTECHNPSFRALDDSPSTRIAAEAAGLGDAPVEVAELQAAFTHEELLLRQRARPRRRRGRQPLRGGAPGQSDHGHRPVPGGVRRRPHLRGRHRALAHATSGPCLQQNLDLHPGGTIMSTPPVAVVGVGQTHHKSRRLDVSVGGLVREAVFRALEDAQMTLADIDAVVLGKAPDLFEGVMKPELYLSDALGAVGKPMFRVHTAGSVGGTTAIVAASHVQAGKHTTVLAVAFEKQSEGNAQFALGSGKGASLGAGGAFAPFIRAYIQRAAPPSTSGGRWRSRTGTTPSRTPMPT